MRCSANRSSSASKGWNSEHEQLDPRVVEGRDPLGDGAIAADEPGQGAAVGAHPAGVGQHLVHLGLGVGAAGDLGPALGVDQRLQMLGLGLRLGVDAEGTVETQPRALNYCGQREFFSARR